MAPSSMKEFLSRYKVAENVSGARKLAILLNDAAAALPKGWVDKRMAAKLVFSLSKAPPADSDFVKKKINGMLQGARTILEKEFGRTTRCDPVDGTIRATINGEDVLPGIRTTDNQIRSKAARREALRKLVNVDELNKAQKEEVKAGDKAAEKLWDAINTMPKQLPAPKKKD